jgi:serine/threonine-protein kinase
VLGPSDNPGVERYELLGELATGGMATVYLGRQKGALGFSRTVAIKSMHPQLAKDPSFRAMFIDEAHLTARIRHPNVVPTLDIVQSDSKLLIIMEYVEGVSLSVLLKAAKARDIHLPVGVVTAIAHDLLEGLHAAHELNDDQGNPFGVVHRDVSPQNILVGVDGVARVVDFGVAKATGRSYKTQTGEIRGKVGYMAPEQMFGENLDRRVDVYAAGVVLWEALAGDRLFNAPTDAALVLLVTRGMVSPPSVARGERLADGYDQLVGRALSQDPSARYATAAEMCKRLMEIEKPASREEVGRWVRDLAASEIASRSGFLRQSSPSLESNALDAESKAVLDVLTRATMTSDVATAGSAPKVPTTRLSVLAVMAVLSTLFLGFALYQARSMTGPRTNAAIAATTESAHPGIAIAPPPAPAPAPVVAPVATPSVAAVEPPAPAPTTKPRPGHKPAPGAKPAAASAPKADCTPPYTTDAQGNRHYKEECLK